MMITSAQTKRLTLDRLLLLCWYITVFSAPFGDCLFRVALPFGGHLFLFRLMILLTCAVYLVYLLRRRENPFHGLSRPERWFVVMIGCMFAYGLVSALRAISLSAWFSKFFTMCQMFAMTFLFLKLCRNPKVMRTTMCVIGISVLFCALGGFAELWHGPFFDTPCRDEAYVFFNRGFYAPIFTLFNPNGFSTYLIFSLECLYLYMAHGWQNPTTARNKRLLWVLTAGTALTIFLCCADSGRLSLLSIPIILLGLALWLLIRYKRGLWVFAALALVTTFIYVGENYSEVKYRADQFIVQVQKSFEKSEPSVPDQPDTPTPDQPDQPEPPPERNKHATLYTLKPGIKNDPAYWDLKESDDFRLMLIMDCFHLFLESHGLGIGLGNLQGAPHCFVMEVLAEFGIFALLPLLAVGLSILKALWLEFYTAIRTRRKTRIAMPLLLFFTALAYAPLSTANASSWSLQAMWFYLAALLLYSGQLSEENRGETSHLTDIVP